MNFRRPCNLVIPVTLLLVLSTIKADKPSQELIDTIGKLILKEIGVTLPPSKTTRNPTQKLMDQSAPSTKQDSQTALEG